jgi:outer membrane protein assembly factor BamB
MALYDPNKPMKQTHLQLASISLVLILSTGVVRAENWPQWRGPAGTSVSSEKDLPIVWHAERGIAWKCPLPEWGDSTPVIWDDAIFLTSHTKEGKLLLLRIDKKSGQIVWSQQVGSGEATREAPKRSTQKFHQLHNLASPSPVTDGKTVVAHFGNGDLAAYDFAGKQIWRRNLQDDYGSYSIWWGHANSPVIFENLVISVCMQDSLSDVASKPVESYLVAHDLRTGELRWKSTRDTKAPAEQADAYTTPILAKLDGKLQLIVMGGNQLDSYDPATGKQLWYLPGLVGGRTVTGPTVAGDMVFATRGQKGPLIAVKPRAGELTHRDIVWEYTEGTPDSCSPVVWNELLFTVTDDGIARAFDVATGNLKWKERLGGKFKASPVAADGRIYFLNTDGLCTVVSASSRFDKLVENQLPDETIASPAISDGHIFIRGKKDLYSISR